MNREEHRKLGVSAQRRSRVWVWLILTWPLVLVVFPGEICAAPFMKRRPTLDAWRPLPPVHAPHHEHRCQGEIVANQ